MLLYVDVALSTINKLNPSYWDLLLHPFHLAKIFTCDIYSFSYEYYCRIYIIIFIFFFSKVDSVKNQLTYCVRFSVNSKMLFSSHYFIALENCLKAISGKNILA